MKHKKVFIDSEKAYIVKNYEQNAKLLDLANFFKVGIPKIREVLVENGAKIRSQFRFNQKYHVDGAYFKNIDSEEKAYWAGFILADGCVKEKSLVICLARKDKEHLQKFLDCLKSDYPIYDSIAYRKYKGKLLKSERSSIEVCSRDIVNDLKKINITKNKTLRAIPVNLSIELMRHFYRGLFDGDGGLSESGGQWKVYQLGTYEICEGFSKYIFQINNEIKLRNPHELSGIFKIEYSGIKLPQKIISIIYDNVKIYLDRKMDLVIKLNQTPVIRDKTANLVGKVFGNIKIIKCLGAKRRTNPLKTDTYYECICTCGKIFESKIGDLKNKKYCNRHCANRNNNK
jgi:hypothetical protein